MKAADENEKAASLSAEGEKVTGGAGSGAQEQKSTSSPSTGGEAQPEEETKKEEMNSYNEHPDQAKVGGG